MAFLPTEDLYDNEIYLRLDRTAEENKEKDMYQPIILRYA